MSDWDWGICVECGVGLDDDYDTLCDTCAEQYHTEPTETDEWADHNTLVSAGWGTDEDYGYYGSNEGWD